MAVGGLASRRTKIKVGGKLAIHPQENGLAKAADHDADRGHQGDGGGQRAHQDRSPVKRARKAAGSQQRLHAQQLAQPGGSKRQQPASQRRDGQGGGGDQQGAGEVAENGRPGNGGSAGGRRAAQAQRQGQPEVAHFVDAGVIFAPSASHGVHRGNQRRLARRGGRRKQGHADAGGQSQSHGGG